MARRRQSFFENLMKVTSRLPWWVGITSAIVVYFALHHVAALEVAKPQGVREYGAVEGRIIYRTLAIIGQYIIPLVLLVGATVSAASSWRRSATNTMTPRDVTATSVRVEPKLSRPSLDLENNSPKPERLSPLPVPLAWSSELLSILEWKRFEDLCAEYYREKGIRCETTSLGADGGIDLKLFQDDSGKSTTIVQCKAWAGRLVGAKPVRELRGVMASEKVEKGFFMTSSAYSDEAKAFAHSNCITLIDATLFLMMIKRLPQEAQDRLLSFATRGDYMTPTCASCGVKMVKRDSKRGMFWGCVNYPRCKQKLNIARQTSP